MPPTPAQVETLTKATGGSWLAHYSLSWPNRSTHYCGVERMPRSVVLHNGERLLVRNFTDLEGGAGAARAAELYKRIAEYLGDTRDQDDIDAAATAFGNAMLADPSGWITDAAAGRAAAFPIIEARHAEIDALNIAG